MALSECERRILLLGKNGSESRKIGNFILKRDAFDTEAPPPPSVEQRSERARGNVGERYITLINTPHLFDPHLSVEELNHRVRDCMSLCAPGPHVIVLVLQPDDFTETDRNRLNDILVSFSRETKKYIMVLTTQKSQSGMSVNPVKENVFQKIITECNNRHIEFRGKCSCIPLMNMIERMVEENGGRYLKWRKYEALATRQQKTHEQTTPNKSEQTVVKKAQDHKEISVPLEKKTQKQHKITPTQSKSEQIMEEKKTILLEDTIKSNEKLTERLNLVLCGHNRAVKSSISDLILGQRELSPESSSVCVRREGEVCGRLVTLVEMPALYNTQLSEEEVMQETLRCVSLCHPGVHAFLLIVSGGRLTDDDKGEIEKIQRIFSSEVNDYLVVLFMENVNARTLTNFAEQNPEAKNLASCGQRSIIVETKMGGNPKQVSELLEEIERPNKPKHYSLHTYMKAQEERIIKELKVERQSEDERQKTEDVRIVMLGKTGVGKSATANTILGKKIYKELLCAKSVTTVCQKESSDDTYNENRLITVIDTPGLFDTNTSNEEISKEIVKCITMAAPGPHVFLLVLALGRFTKEEQDAVKIIQELFGEESRRYTMVLFTRGDDLKEMKMSIEDFIKNADCSLQNIIRQCENRYHSFSNRNADRSQVTDLLEKIDSMVAVNGGSFYTNEKFQQAEKALQEEQERILKENKEETEREKEELRKKHEAEVEEMKKIIEEERQKQEKEMKKREEKFKEREEQIKREFAERERLKERQREEDQRRREQEEKERRKKEEEWKKKQREEMEKIEKEQKETIQKQRDHQKKLQQEYEQKIKEEEKRRRELEEKIKHAEESKKKELLDLQLTQQREWKRRKQEEEEKRREEQEENKRKEKRKSLENKWIFQQNPIQQQYEDERKTEMEKRALEEGKKKQKEEEEKKRIENEANEKIKQMQREREELYEKQLAYMREMHELQMEKLRKETELAARKEAEQEFCDKLERKFEVVLAERQESKEAEAQNANSGGGIGAAMDCVWGLLF